MPDPVIPMQIPVGFGLFTISFKSIYSTKVYSCNFGFSGTIDEGGNPAEDILAYFTATGCPAAPASYTDRFQLLGGHVLYRDDVDLLVFDFPSVVAGTGHWESPPSNTSILVQKLTGRAGRSQKGRVYWPAMAVDEAQVDVVGAIDSTRVGLLQTQWNTLYDQFTPEGYSLFLLHGGTVAHPTTAPPPTAVTRFAVEPVVATQRRRMR